MCCMLTSINNSCINLTCRNYCHKQTGNLVKDRQPLWCISHCVPSRQILQYSTTWGRGSSRAIWSFWQQPGGKITSNIKAQEKYVNTYLWGNKISITTTVEKTQMFRAMYHQYVCCSYSCWVVSVYCSYRLIVFISASAFITSDIWLLKETERPILYSCHV